MAYFTQSVVQERVKDFFIHSLDSNHLAHAYILYGASGRGKEAFALELAKALNCSSEGDKPCNTCPSCSKINKFSHPDIKYIFPAPKGISTDQVNEILHLKARNPYAGFDVGGNKNISIDAIRELKNEAKYAAYEAGKRVFIIYGAEYFSREVANSFLKLLEEPPEDLFILLISDDIKSLLDTIRSRCQPVYFPEFSESQIAEILNRYENDLPDITALARAGQYDIKKIYQLLHSDMTVLRSQVYDFIKATAAGNFFGVNTLIDKLTLKRDKQLLQEFLNLLLLWFRDSLRFQLLAEDHQFVILDYEDSIKKFANYYRHVEMEKLIYLSEQAAQHLRMNLHPALTLTNLAIQLNHCLVQQTAIKEAV